ncbi:virulence protein MsgA [Yersinia entomophaga]|uniref:Virulence protein MsgA n=2 Tax=Yersinia TaxID=629 RepID=A0ABN4Q0P8_YERET|nr:MULTISPECIES: DinI-like family protein [Yersinia]ANI31505.1 virulence protein MsgA [Yersinia entomophaga]MDN0087048.1 DinI-like family protein [Yersinia nurmii]OWF87857.1 DinI family protein [Yersinia entomophaga]CNE14764.1 putative stress response protein [Yersinia nurmii]
MRIELIYDKRNVGGLTNATDLIKEELTKRVHRIHPEADVHVKAMQANGLNVSGVTKLEKSALNRLIEEMFEEADEWLTMES